VNTTPIETLANLVSRGLQLDPRELNSSLQAVWPLVHGPLFQHDKATLVALFKRAGYVSDGAAYPTDGLTVYRREPIENEQLGISWTTDLQVARTYAQRYSSIGDVQVLQATAPVPSILARFTFEDEVVVEPALLTDVVRLPRFDGQG
jgi:hypothetical protein